jgi:hypothetical protein
MNLPANAAAEMDNLFQNMRNGQRLETDTNEVSYVFHNRMK